MFVKLYFEDEQVDRGYSTIGSFDTTISLMKEIDPIKYNDTIRYLLILISKNQWFTNMNIEGLIEGE